jgi:hypothetical protein
VVSGYKPIIVGRFFEQVAHELFGGELCRNENGDICLFREGITLEVKSSCIESQYGFRLELDQIEHYKSLIPFPFKCALYVLMSYDNPRISKSTQLAPHVMPEAINAYLAHYISSCVAVELPIVAKWKEVLPISTKSLLGHLGTKTVDIKCPEVVKYVNGGLAGQLGSIGLDPNDYGLLTGRAQLNVGFDPARKYRLAFPMHCILRKPGIRKLQLLLAGRGHRLKAV